MVNIFVWSPNMTMEDAERNAVAIVTDPEEG